MKRTLLLTALSATLLFSNTTEAQSIPVVSSLPKVTLGVKLGGNFEQISGDNLNTSYQGGLMGGAFVGLQKKKFGVQVEGLIKSVNYDINFGGSTLKTVSLDIPVLFEYKLIPRLWVQVGPQFTSVLSTRNSSDSLKNTIKSGGFSGVLGLEVRLPVHFTAGARYILGFTNVNNESFAGSSEAWKERSFQLYVGFRFL